MKKLLSIAIALAFFGSLVGVAAASGTATTTDKKTEDKKMDKAADKAEKKADKKPSAKSANGTVKSATADSIVVAGKEKGKDAEWTFAVDPNTKIKRSGKDATAADVKAGDSVQVKYTEDGGKATAQSVTAKEAKMKKAENPCAAKKAPAEKK